MPLPGHVPADPPRHTAVVPTARWLRVSALALALALAAAASGLAACSGSGPATTAVPSSASTSSASASGPAVTGDSATRPGATAAGGASPGSSDAGSTPTAPPGATPAVATAPWSLPIPISRPAVAVVGSRILVLGGLTTGDTSTDAVLRIDPGAGTVERLAPLAQKVHDSAGTGLGADGALVFAGGSSGITDAVQRWSPAGTSGGDHLPAKRADLVATRVGDRAIVLGGTNGTTLETQVLATTDGRSFTGLGSLAQGVRYPAVATVGTTIWLFGGETQATEGGRVVRTDVVQTFDVATGRGQVVGHLPQPRSHAMAFALADRIFLAGGRTDAGAVATVESVETGAGFRLQPAGSLPGPRSDSGVAVIGRTAYLVGGEVKGATDPQRSVLVVTA